MTATINFQGSITTLLDRKPLVDSISFSARTQDGKGGIGVPLFGAKLVLVNGFSLRRGGRVHVEYVSALDALALLGELIANRGVGVNPNREAIGQQMVNEEAEKKIRSWVLANRNNVVPGVDLAQVLGIN